MPSTGRGALVARLEQCAHFWRSQITMIAPTTHHSQRPPPSAGPEGAWLIEVGGVSTAVGRRGRGRSNDHCVWLLAAGMITADLVAFGAVLESKTSASISIRLASARTAWMRADTMLPAADSSKNSADRSFGTCPSIVPSLRQMATAVQSCGFSGWRTSISAAPLRSRPEALAAPAW